jgi:hypothetical protein
MRFDLPVSLSFFLSVSVALWQISLAAGHTNALIVSFRSSAAQVQAPTGREPPHSKTSTPILFHWRSD